MVLTGEVKPSHDKFGALTLPPSPLCLRKPTAVDLELHSPSRKSKDCPEFDVERNF